MVSRFRKSCQSRSRRPPPSGRWRSLYVSVMNQERSAPARSVSCCPLIAQSRCLEIRQSKQWPQGKVSSSASDGGGVKRGFTLEPGGLHAWFGEMHATGQRRMPPRPARLTFRAFVFEPLRQLRLLAFPFIRRRRISSHPFQESVPRGLVGVTRTIATSRQWSRREQPAAPDGLRPGNPSDRMLAPLAFSLTTLRLPARVSAWGGRRMRPLGSRGLKPPPEPGNRKADALC